MSVIASSSIFNSLIFGPRWDALPISDTLTLHTDRIPRCEEVEVAARKHGLFTIRSGDIGAHLTWVFYARDTENRLYMADALLEKASGRVTVTLKAEAADVTVAADALRLALQSVAA